MSCRACSAWRSATCPAPPTSSACRRRSSRTCGRCWRTGCWRYRPDGSPLPRRPCVLGSGHPGAALLGHPGLNNNQQDASVAHSPGPGLSLGHPSRLPTWCPFPFPNPDSDCQWFGTLTNPLFGSGKRDRGHLFPSGFSRVSCAPPPPPSPVFLGERAPGKPWTRPPQSGFLCLSRGSGGEGGGGGARAVPAVWEMKSAGGSGRSLLPSFWVCAVGGGNS